MQESSRRVVAAIVFAAARFLEMAIVLVAAMVPVALAAGLLLATLWLVFQA